MRTNNELLSQSRESLSGRWGLAIGGFFLGGVVTGVAGSIPFIGVVASLIISGPMMLGMAIFAQSYSRKDREPQIDQLFKGFENFKRT